MRDYLAVLIAFVAGTAFAVVVIAVTRLVGPDAQLVRHRRLPAWWRQLTGWSRSRSLRLWCPDPATAAAVAAQLCTATGRRLSRLGASIAPGPWDADVIVIERLDADRLEAERARAPRPIATIVLADAADADELRDAIVSLSAALRWPDAGGDA